MRFRRPLLIFCTFTSEFMPLDPNSIIPPKGFFSCPSPHSSTLVSTVPCRGRCSSCLNSASRFLFDFLTWMVYRPPPLSLTILFWTCESICQTSFAGEGSGGFSSLMSLLLISCLIIELSFILSRACFSWFSRTTSSAILFSRDPPLTLGAADKT